MKKKFKKINRISGELNLPGDKSISHRAVIFSAMAKGSSSIQNISLGEDVKSTMKIMKQLGAIVHSDSEVINIEGCGMNGFAPSPEDLDCGNSGTSARLIAGLLSAQNFSSTLIGDESLSKRPMKRVIDPLKSMGVDFKTNEFQNLPVTIIPNQKLIPIKYEMPIASAQVKSSILIAGLHSEEETIVIESEQTRNHTETMLGLPVKNVGSKIISTSNKNYYPIAKDYFIPGDISSAAFHIVLTLLTPNSELIIKNVSLNQTRIGFIKVLKEMGANIIFKDIRSSSNEEYGNVYVKSSKLRNIKIESTIVANIIDEIPILTIAGLFADGNFTIQNAKELRVKESDRIHSICSNLNLLGLEIKEMDDGFTLSGKIKNKDTFFESYGDHRIAMSFAILSMILENGGEVNGFECVSISNPQFENQLKNIIS
jgi:3-phosphoshikimate 1-carboxyvinyltransferase